MKKSMKHLKEYIYIYILKSIKKSEVMSYDIA